jgi:AraC-like DNA-binding protein
MTRGGEEMSAVATRTSAAPTRWDAFETTDPDRAEAFLTSTYGNLVKISGRPVDYRFRHAQIGPGPFHINSVQYAASTEVHAGAYSALSVMRMHRGVRTSLDSDRELGPGDLALHGPPGRPSHLRLVDVAYTSVVVPMQAVAEAARNRPDDELGPLHFASLRPCSTAAAQVWLRTVAYVTDCLRINPDGMAEPLLSGTTARLLSATLLATFPNSWTTAAPDRNRITSGTTTALSRAIAFIEANPDLDISVADIARAASVTVRAVQVAFRRHRDTTPTAYLRRVRLDGVHEALRDATPGDGTTITEIAARWGFADPSRFSALYRRTYGQPPSHTLRN